MLKMNVKSLWSFPVKWNTTVYNFPRPQSLDLFLADLFPASLSTEDSTKHWILMFSIFKPPHVKALKIILHQKRRCIYWIVFFKKKLLLKTFVTCSIKTLLFILLGYKTGCRITWICGVKQRYSILFRNNMLSSTVWIYNIILIFNIRKSITPSLEMQSKTVFVEPWWECQLRFCRSIVECSNIVLYPSSSCA